MTDLYPELLREVEVVQFGATLQSLVKLGKRGNQMETKKLVLVINGKRQDPIACNMLNFQIEGDTVTLEASLVADTEEAPAVDGIDSVMNDTIFMLQGDDLDALTLLSDFRAEPNKITGEDGLPPVAVTIESGVYNIQDMTAIQNASLDLIAQERTYLDDGYQVVEVSVPRYIYENINDFKLIETAVLHKTADKPAEVASVEE